MLVCIVPALVGVPVAEIKNVGVSVIVVEQWGDNIVVIPVDRKLEDKPENKKFKVSRSESCYSLPDSISAY